MFDTSKTVDLLSDVDLYYKTEYAYIGACLDNAGQYACLAETKVYSDKEQTVWTIIGNNDAFSI